MKKTLVLALQIVVLVSVLVSPLQGDSEEIVVTELMNIIPGSQPQTSLSSRNIYSLVMAANEFVTPQFQSDAAANPLKTDLSGSFNKWLKQEKTENALFTASLLTMTALNIADYFSTREALKHSGVDEGNPLMKPFVKNDLVFATVKAGFTALSFYSLKSIYHKDKRLGWVLTTVSNFILSYVVANNIAVINKTRTRGR